jgi:TP901 family phage tail tape measure protein
MAAFNLTAQLNLKGPSNIGSIVSSIKNQLGNINTTVKFTLDPNAAKNVSQLDASLKSLNQTFKDTQQSATAAATAISKFTSAMSQGNSVGQYSNQLNQANQAAKNLSSTQTATSKAIEESSSSMQEFGKQAGLAVRRFAAFSSVTSVIYGLVNAVGKGTSEFISFDKEFVKLQQVTGESAEGLKSLGRVITGLSAGLGTSSAELVDIASTLAQAGLSARDTEKALKALALSSLAPSFDSMNETVEGSIALMRQFDISASDLEKALGAVNSVAAKFAVEASDIITAIQRTGGVFATASKGVSQGTDALNEFIAVFTSVRATTRESAETIATGLRTIFTRVQRESTIEALKEYGVNLQNLDGKFVGAYKAVELLSQGLSRLDTRDVKFSKIIEELGGFRQIGKVIPLIQEFSTAQQALSVAQQGQGSLATDAAKAQLSLANQIAKTREEFLALFRDIGSSNTFQTMVTGALQLTSALIKVVGAAKGLLPMFTAIAAVQGAKAISRFAGGLYQGLSGGGKDSSKQGFATGGLVPGVGDADSVPAMLTPGEFVVRKAAVKAMGVNKLHSMNKYANGDNIKPQKFALGGPASLYQDIEYVDTYDGDSLRVKIKPSEKLVKMKIKDRYTQDLVYPSTQKYTKMTSRLENFDAYERKDTPTSRGTKEGQYKEKAESARQTTENWAERAGDSGIEKAFDDSNNVEYFGRPLFRSEALVRKLTDKKEGKIFDTNNLIGIDKLTNRMRWMEEKQLPASTKRYWTNLISKEYQSNYRLDENGAAKLDNNNEPITNKNRKGGLSKQDNDFFDIYSEIGDAKAFKGRMEAFNAFKENIEDSYRNAQYAKGGRVQRLAAGGVAQRKVGYIDYDVIANSDNEAVVKKGMEATGTTGPRLYTDYLTQLAVKARKDSSLDRLRAVYGVAGSGKTTLARGQGTDSGTLRQTERFPILSPEDIQRATEILVLSSSVSKDKLDDFFGETDRTYTLSSTTKEEREGVRSRRAGRDISGIGLENRQPGSTTNAATDTAVSEALLSDRLGARSVVLGRSESGRLRRKQGDELVDIIKKKIGFSWGGFAPMTAGHESIMDAAAAMGIAPEDFIYLVGSNEGIKPGDPSSYRTAVFDQDFRMVLAKAGAGSRGATVLPKPRDFEVPQAFDISQEGSDRRTVLLPKKGSRTFVADKGPEQTKKYKEAGYAVSNIERSGGISGTMVRDLIMAGDMGKLQEVLSPNVYEIISNNIGRLQNRANALPEIIEQVQKSQGVELAGVEKEIKAVGITRVDNKKAAADPEYAAKVQALQDLRDKRDKIKSSASFEPYRILAEMARKNPEKYGLDLSTTTDNIPSMRTMSSAKIQQFVDGGWVQRMQSQKKSTLREDLKFLQSAMVFSDETGSYVPTYAKENEKEVVDAKEMLERYNAMSQFITGPRSAKSGLKPTGGYNPQELLDAVTYYQAGSGPLTRAMVNNDFIFTDRNEAYDTEDLVGRLSAASQYKLPKKLYSGFGRGQFNEILKDTNTTADDLIGKRDQAIESLIGQTVDFPTFLSTSVNPTVAEGFVGDPGALFSIDASKSKSMGIDILKAKSTSTTSAPPESRRLPGLDKIKQHKLAGYDQEKEFILQPNSQFKILSAKGKVANSLKETLTGIKKDTQKSSNMVSDTGEEFTVFEPDYDNDIAETLNAKTRINIQAQMLASGGKAQRFAEGGRALSPLLQSIYDSMKDKPEWLKEFGLPDNVTTDVPAKTIAQLYSGRNFPTDPSFGMFAGKPVSIDNVNAVWRKSFATSMSPEKTANYTAAKNYLAQELKDDTTEQTRLTIRDLNKSTKLGIVGLQPTDKKEIQGPMKLGDKNVTLFIAGLSSQYDEAVKNMRRGVDSVVGQFGADMQDTKIFGSSEKYAFDFDETLVTGADILDANGKPDIPRYGNIDAVRESMKGAKLTQLGEKVKRLMALDPSFIKKARILTARPQMTAGILSDTLQGLGLPFQESDITGVSTPVGDGGLNIVDEKTKRINNSIIAKAKAQDVRELEALIDDNLQNVTETKKSGKKAFHYTELKDLTPEEKAASGFPNIEGAITQAVMTVLGATGGLIQNGAVDYENGLGPAAQYFPGIDSDWPTEVKRTLDSNAISDAKKEFTRYYKENGNKGILAQAFASGGLAEAPKKEKEYGKIGLTEDGTMINAGYFKNDTRSGYATAYKMRDYLYYVGLSSATSGYGPKLYDVLMEAATEKGAMLTSDRSLVSGDAQNVWEYYFNNRSDVQKTPLKPSDWTRNNALIDPKLYGKEETWPPANDPAWILQSGYSKSPSIINGPDVVRSSAKVDYRALMSSFFSEKRGSSEPAVASNSNGEEFTVGYSEMATGGKVNKHLEQYRQILSSILPPEMLTKDGMLKMPSGQGESIDIIPPAKKNMMQSLGLASYDPGKAYYSGGLDYKALRHLLNQRRSELAPEESETLDRFISENLLFAGNQDEISLGGAKHKGVLAHETFHDIQGFLYDNYPEIMDKLSSSLGSQKENIEAWYKDPSNRKFTGKGNYQLRNLFPKTEEDSPYGSYLQDNAREALIKKKRSKEIPNTTPGSGFYRLLSEAQKQLGANEAIPVLLGAASEGNKSAAEILSKVFSDAGLKPDFMDTLPRFAAGGMVPGVGNGDTVPAMLNVGDFVIRKSSVNSIGPDKLASMAGYAAGGSVSDKVPALLTPGEFVFSKTAAQKIGYPKLHSMNKVGKFASGGAVGLRMGYADGGAIQDLGKFLSNLSAILNSIPTKAMNIRPNTIDSSTTKIEDTVLTEGLGLVGKALQDLGLKASESAALVKRGGDISYKAAIDALEVDLERAKIAGLSSKQIIAMEDLITSARGQSNKVVGNKQFLEKSFSNSDIGKKGGSGAAQQAILTKASELEPKIRENTEYSNRLSLMGSGLSSQQIAATAKSMTDTPESREKIKSKSIISATEEVTGIDRKEFTKQNLEASDIQKYISQSMLDRKTLTQMDRQVLADKMDELQRTKAFRQASFEEQKKMLDQIRAQAKQETSQRREVLDPMAKEQGLPGLKDGSITQSLSGIFSSKAGLAGLGLLATAPGLMEAFGPSAKTSGSAAFMGGLKGAGETASAGLTLAGQLPGAAGPILAATAIATLASAATKARNAFIEFEKNLANRQLEASLSNLQQLFAELAKDTKDIRIQNQISAEIQKGAGNVSRIEQIESSFPKAFFANSLDALFASRDSRDIDTGNGTQASSDRAKILEKFGTAAYYRSTGFGQANLGFTPFGADDRADKSRKAYLEMMAPEEAQERAKRSSALSESSQAFILNKAKSGMTATEISKEPDYEVLARSIALANNAVQEQILAIERSNLVNKEAAKTSIIRQYAEEQLIKITRQAQQERAMELSERAGRQFSMSFDRMFANMNQVIMSTNNSLDIFNNRLESSANALSGQASIGKTNLDTINTLKTPNISSSASFSAAASTASSLFGTENKLIESILVLGRDLESSLMSTINNTIQNNPKASDTKISSDIENSISRLLGRSNLPTDLTAQLSKSIGVGITEIRRKEGEGTKDRKIDFAELLRAIPGLKDTVDALKTTNNSVISSLENYQTVLDRFTQKLEASSEKLREAADRRFKAEDIVIDSSIQLARTFGSSINPALGNVLRDQRTSRMTGGVTDPNDILLQINQLQSRSSSQRDNLSELKNRTVGQSGATQTIIDNEKALNKTNYQLNQTYTALKNLADSSDAASNALSAIQAAQQKQAGKVSLIEKLVTSGPEELDSFNKALVRLQRTAGGESFYQTSDQRKEILSVLNDITPLMGSGQEANNFKANTLENLLKTSGIGLNPQFQSIINSIRDPEADPAVKQATEEYKNAVQVQSEANKAIAELNTNISTKLVEDMSRALKDSITNTRVKFDEGQIRDIVAGIRSATTVVAPGAPVARATGGIIYSSAGSYIDFQPKGTDTVPAMLTPGEFVMSKPAVDRIGSGTLSRMNKGYSNGGQVSYYADGGYVSSILQNKYVDRSTGDPRIRKTGTFSIDNGTQNYPNLSEELTVASLNTFKNLQTLPNFGNGTASGQIDNSGKKSETYTIGYSGKSNIGYGVPPSATYLASFYDQQSRGGYKYTEPAGGGTISIVSLGDFLSPGTTTTSILDQKPLTFDGPELEANKKFEQYIDKLRQVNKFLPTKIQQNNDAYDISVGAANFNIPSPDKVNNGIKEFPSVRTTGKRGEFFIKDMSKPVSGYVGLYSDRTAGPSTIDGLLEHLGAGHSETDLPDIVFQRLNKDIMGISPQTRSTSNTNGFTGAGKKSEYDYSVLPPKPVDYGVSQSFMDGWISGLGKSSKTLKLPGSDMSSLVRLRDIITGEEYINDLESQKLTAKEAEYESIIAAKLKRISDKTESSVDIGNDYFDLKKLGSDSNSINVFSISSAEWSPYAKMLQQSINNSKDKETLEKLSYYGKDPKKLPFDVWPEGNFAQVQQFGWMDSKLEFDKATTAQITRKVQDRAKQASPDIIDDSITGKIKLNDPQLELPYRLRYSRTTNPTWWDTRTNSKSEKSIVDGFDSLYLLNGGGEAADAKGSADNILQALNTGDKRLFATANGLDKYIPDQLSEQINNDPKVSAYLKSVIASGYDSAETQKLERSNLDSIFKLNLSKNLLGLLTKADVPGGFGDQFKETGDIFGGDIQFFLRDYIVESAKKLSSDKKAKELGDSKKKFGDRRDTSKLLGFDEGQEFAGASLALVLGAEELFGPGGEFELPGILPKNWFKPVLPTQFNSIYDMPQGLIREGMGRLGSWLSDASGRVEQYITPEMAQKNPRQYDEIIRAQTYMKGALSAFTSFKDEATGGVKEFFDPDLFKGAPTPNGNPEAIEQAIRMFQSIGTNDTSTDTIFPRMTGVLTQDKKNRISKDLEGSRIDKSSTGKDTIDLQEFNPLELDGGTYKNIFAYALSPYNQYTNRDIRARFFDEFITKIPTATRGNGAPLFSTTTAARYDTALKSLKSWFGGDNPGDPLRMVAGNDWPGIDYLYDQSIKDPTTNTAIPFDNRFTQLKDAEAKNGNFYDFNKNAFDFVGAKGMFGELPDLSDYAKRKVEYKNQGGLIYASEGQLINFQSRGTDTVPAMLTPGEFVVNAGATSRNLSLLQKMNGGGEVIYRATGSDSPEGLSAPKKSSYFFDNAESGTKAPKQEFLNNPKYNFNGWMFSGDANLPGPFSNSGRIDLVKFFGAGKNQVLSSDLYKAVDDNSTNLKQWYGGLLANLQSKSEASESTGDKSQTPFENRPSIMDNMQKAYLYKYIVGRNKGKTPVGPEDPLQSAKSTEVYEESKKRQREDRSWLPTEGRTWLQYFGAPTSGSEVEANIYGLLSKVMPGVLGVLGAGIGFAAGSPLGPGAIVPGIAGGIGGNMAGQWLNERAFELLPENFRQRIESKIQEHPENYASGQWIGFGAELGVGAAYGKVIEQAAKREFADASRKVFGSNISRIEYLRAIGSEEALGKASQIALDAPGDKLASKYLKLTDEEIRAAYERAEKIAIERAQQQSGKVTLAHGGQGGRIGKSGQYAGTTEVPSNIVKENINTARTPNYRFGEGGDPYAGVNGRPADAVGMGGFNAGLHSITDNVNYAVEAYNGIRSATAKGALPDDIGLLMGDITAEGIRRLGFDKTPSAFLSENVPRLFDDARTSNPELFEALVAKLKGDGDLSSLRNLLENRNATWSDALNTLRDSVRGKFKSDWAGMSEAEKAFQDTAKSLGIFGTREQAKFIRDPSGMLDVSGESLGLYTTEFFEQFNNMKLSELTRLDTSFKAALERFREHIGHEIVGEGKEYLADRLLVGEESHDTHHTQEFNLGGLVYANRGKYINFQPKGTDTVPAMLTPGEFVINARSTAQHLPLLKAINSGDDVSSPSAMNTGGLAYLAVGGRAPSGMTPAGAQATPKQLTRQEKANKIAAMGMAPRLQESQLDTDTGTIVWNSILKENTYAILRDSLQKSFNRLAQSGTSDSQEDRNNTLLDFKELSYQLKENINKYKAADYGKAVTYLQSLKREYELAADPKTAGADKDWRFRKNQAQTNQPQQPQQAPQQPAQNQNPFDLRNGAGQNQGPTAKQKAQTETREKNARIAAMGVPKRIDNDDLDRVTGSINWPDVLQDDIFNENRQNIEKIFKEYSLMGPADKTIDKESGLYEFKNLKALMKENVNNYDAGRYGKSRTFVDRLENEFIKAHKNGAIGLATGGLVYSNNQALSNSNSNYASGGIVYANNGALIDAQASGTDTVPAMLTPGEFVVNRNSAQKFMPVLNAINGGAYSAGGIVNYLANGGFVQPHYLSRGNEDPIGAMSQISNSSGVLNNSVGQNMVMAKPAWVDEFIGQAREVSQAIGNALTDVTSQLNSVGSTMTDSAQKLANTSKTLSETKFPEEIILTHSGNIVTDMLPQRVNEIVQRSIDTSVAISNTNIDSAMASINRGIMKDSEGAMGKTG